MLSRNKDTIIVGLTEEDSILKVSCLTELSLQWYHRRKHKESQTHGGGL